MLDIKFVRENPDAIDVAMANRQTSWDREKFFELDDERRAVITTSRNSRLRAMPSPRRSAP